MQMIYCYCKCCLYLNTIGGATIQLRRYLFIRSTIRTRKLPYILHPYLWLNSTRQADTASGSGNSEVFNDSEGVLFADIAALANDGTVRKSSISRWNINQI